MLLEQNKKKNPIPVLFTGCWYDIWHPLSSKVLQLPCDREKHITWSQRRKIIVDTLTKICSLQTTATRVMHFACTDRSKAFPAAVPQSCSVWFGCNKQSIKCLLAQMAPPVLIKEKPLNETKRGVVLLRRGMVIRLFLDVIMHSKCQRSKAQSSELGPEVALLVSVIQR